MISANDTITITREQYYNLDGMSETLTMIRQDLVDMNLISDGVPPMFLTESLCMHIRELLKAERTRVVDKCIELANKYAAGGAGSEFDVGYIACADALAEEIKKEFGVSNVV